MADTKKLIFSIIKFLQKEKASNNLTEDSKESLDVAIQCLESAYNVKYEDKNSIDASPELIDVFSEACGETKQQVTEEMKTNAEKLKMEGNEFMKSQKFPEAIQQYDEAIKLDPYNAVYFCNRAAAHSKMENHQAAINDCSEAIRIEPTYSKAYGRMGLAYASLNNHVEARNCYQKAVDLDESNESYKNNLKIAEEKVKETSSAGPAPGGMNFGNLLNNPALMNMASTLMSDPAMQNLMSNIMSDEAISGSGGLGGGGGSSGGGSGGGGLDGLLQVGQQLANQMQSSNPELVEQLRRQMGGNSSQPPPPDQNDSNKDT